MKEFTDAQLGDYAAGPLIEATDDRSSSPDPQPELQQDLSTAKVWEAV